VWGLGFGVAGLGFGVEGLGCGVWGEGLREAEAASERQKLATWDRLQGLGVGG
jgi:hypothetical protein